MLATRADALTHALSSEGRDIKLQADLEAERLILERLAEVADIPVLAEESGWSGPEDERPRRYWVVDPLDGTANYSRGIDLCCTAIALLVDDRPHLGVVYDFHRDALFVGHPGAPATRNGQEIRVSKTAETQQAVLMTGIPTRMELGGGAAEAMAADFARWKKVRMIGTAALAAIYVADGRADRYFEQGTMLWDVAAAAAIVEAAGGRCDFQPLGDWRYRVMMDNGCLPI